MVVDETLIKDIMDLSALIIHKEDMSQFINDFGNMINLIDSLNELDTDDVEELVNIEGVGAASREDIALDNVNTKEFLENANKSNSGYFMVPKFNI